MDVIRSSPPLSESRQAYRSYANPTGEMTTSPGDLREHARPKGSHIELKYRLRFPYRNVEKSQNRELTPAKAGGYFLNTLNMPAVTSMTLDFSTASSIQ